MRILGFEVCPDFTQVRRWLSFRRSLTKVDKVLIAKLAGCVGLYLSGRRVHEKVNFRYPSSEVLG
jgi:hypothetical protein